MNSRIVGDLSSGLPVCSRQLPTPSPSCLLMARLPSLQGLSQLPPAPFQESAPSPPSSGGSGTQPGMAGPPQPCLELASAQRASGREADTPWLLG